MSSKGRLSTTLDESPRDVIDILPAVHRFYTRGEITLADYNRNWPIILCCEISKKIGLNLVYKQTMTMTEAGPARVVSVWFMSISYRYICGYQPVTPGLTEEENVREILGALYNRLSDVGALPSGIARLCARYELLRPVVLLTIPWFQHLMNKLDETLYKDLKFDLPTRPVNETTVRVKIDSLTQHMQKWSAHYWTSKLFMRCPSYVNMVRLWGAGVPNIRLPNDQFCYVYEASGIKGGKIQFAEDFLADNNDPQKQRKILQARLNNPPEAGPHALLLGIPPALTAYLDGLDETSPLNLGVDEYINFAQGGADKSKSKEQPMPTTLIGQSHFGRSLTHASAPKDDVLFVPVDKPSDFQITIHEEKPGVSMLIHNLPDDEKDPMIARQLEYTTTSEILAIVGIKDGEYDVIGRVKADGYSKFYKVRSLHVRLKPHVRKPDLQDLNHTLRRNPRLKTFAIGWYNEENEKYKRGFEKKNSNEAKRSSRENRRSRSRSSSRERYRKHERRRSRSPRKSKSPGSHRNSKGSSHKFSAADQDFKDLYARRVKNFVSGVAETADCQLIVNSVVEPQQIRSQVKFSGIPFMMLGATGLALEPKQAENLALVTLIGRLVDYGILPNVLVDLISTYDEWCEPVCKVIGPCVNFAKAILKSPDYANILMEIDSYERSGMQFLQATRADQIFGVTKFAQTMIEFGGRHWKTTLIIAPEKLPHLPNVSDGTVRIVAWDSKEARDERTKERAIKDKQERRRAAEEKQRKRDKKQKDSKKRSRSSSRGRNRDEKSMSIEYDDGSPMDIEKKPETTFVDLVSDSSIDSDEEDPAAALKRLAEKEEELERKNREIQKQLELVDKGLLEPEAALALLRSLSKDSKEKKARQREKDAGKKSLKDRSRSSSPKKSQRDGRVDGSNSGEDPRLKLLGSRDNEKDKMNKYTGRGEEKNKEIVINLKSNENQNQSDPMNFNRENQNRGIQKSRAELLEELKNQTTGSVASNTSMTGPSAMFMAKTSGYSLPDTALTTIYTNPILAQTSTSYPGVPPPPPFGTMEGFPQPVPSVQQPPIATVYPHNSAAPPIPTSNMPSVAGNEELRKQAELLEEQIKLMQRLEELKRQIGGGSTSASVGPSTAPPVQQPQNPAQIFGSPPAPQMQQPFVDPIRLQRLRVLRAQLPAFIPDWCIEFVNEAEKITPFYLQKICEAVQDPMELRQLLMEPSYCHEHDPGSLTCVFHRHVGLQHSTLDCVMTLPWSRRLRLAELNKICLDKKMCIMPHRGECTLRSQPCQFCGEPHFLAWCKKQAMLRNLYDVADEQPAISAIPNAPMAAGNPNVVPTYSYS